MYSSSLYSISTGIALFCLAGGLSGCDLVAGVQITEKPVKMKPGIASRPFNISATNVGQFKGEDIKQLANYISINYPQSAPINLEVDQDNQSPDQGEQEGSTFGLFGLTSPDDYHIAFKLSQGYELNHIEGVGVELTLNDGMLNNLTTNTEDNAVDRLTNNVFFKEYMIHESDISRYQLVPISTQLEEQFPKTIPMSDAHARKLVESGKLIMVCNLKEPWMQSILSKEVATIEKPLAGNRLDMFIYMDLVQLWLIDTSTGKVIQKWRKA